MHTSMLVLTSVLYHLLPLEQDYSFIQNIPHEELGQPIGNIYGTLDHHWKIILVSNVMYCQPMTFDMLKQSKIFLPEFLSRLSHQRIILISQQ